MNNRVWICALAGTQAISLANWGTRMIRLKNMSNFCEAAQEGTEAAAAGEYSLSFLRLSSLVLISLNHLTDEFATFHSREQDHR